MHQKSLVFILFSIIYVLFLAIFVMIALITYKWRLDLVAVK